ncbi:hypothetical protein [Paraburkholderia humisilvae]|uniref:Uncharacterized protein n=1 Tax=Paraburkholderia humisilvae TaxID=627669 RepID=A0A6J5DNK8_9BURK|nr:hypothetical protein [Paraburkholderia humisilvae]CAB3754821.1 hypothetical protein LMG29542_02462 [Paraburkholderia humisilvae]
MTTLSRQHYKRLRFYWQGRANGGAGMTDGVDLDLAALGMVERFERLGSGVCFRITQADEQKLRPRRRARLNAVSHITLWRAAWHNGDRAKDV